MKAPPHLGVLQPSGAPAKPRRFDSLETRITKKRERTRRATHFRDAVWKRDQGICQVCQRRVRRTLEPCPEQGHVHHRRGRNVAPQDRYNVAKAMLVCLRCHAQIHDGTIQVGRRIS